VISVRKWASFVFDWIILLFLFIWISGGVTYHGHLYLKHGADSRRAALLVAILGYFLFPEFRKTSRVLKLVLAFGNSLKSPHVRTSAYIIVLLFTVALAIEQTLALRVTLYDVGIFHQILWNLSHGFGFQSTISGAGNFLRDHLALSLSLLVLPFKLCLETPFFLPIIQSVLIWGGTAAWVYLASRIPGVPEERRQKLAAATTIFAFSFDSLWGNLRWGFHENAIAFISLSWALALLFTSTPQVRTDSHTWRKLGILFLFLIAALSKEIILLNVGLALLVWAIAHWKSGSQNKSLFDRAFPFVLLGLSGVLFVLFVAFEKMSHPSDKNYFNRYYSYLGNDLNHFIITLIFSPVKVIQTIGTKQLVGYFFTVFLPWIFLPIILIVQARKVLRTPELGNARYAPLWLMIPLPSFLSALLATYPPLRGSSFHYVLELWPVLAAVTLIELSRKKSEVWIWLWPIFALLRMDHDPVGDFREYWKRSKETAEIREKIKGIPNHFTVIADELAGTWIAGRPTICRWPDVSLIPAQCPDVLLIRNPDTNLSFTLQKIQCPDQAHLHFQWQSREWALIGIDKASPAISK
jgi:uncharacterized membrane protein